ncbi:hypothetical protein [Streptomyces sp. CRN 30]|uniref:hypothetical protein n=1 Tax=Streptomyces sp. CRN 30 TaxID=3075613 RepID=UPI002A8105C6|nr:hypothetical protein [Streptomyces sp. CRN 30]
MVRRRWAMALVLLVSSVLLNLVAPNGGSRAADGAPPLSGVSVMPSTGSGADSHRAESLTDPCPCDDGTATRRVAVRPARTAGAAGTAWAIAPVRESAAGRDSTDLHDAAGAERPAAGAPPTGAVLLQTFRC